MIGSAEGPDKHRAGISPPSSVKNKLRNVVVVQVENALSIEQNGPVRGGVDNLGSRSLRHGKRPHAGSADRRRIGNEFFIESGRERQRSCFSVQHESSHW